MLVQNHLKEMQALDLTLDAAKKDRFIIREKLGAGSMSEIYRATQESIGQEVAIKVLRTDRQTDENDRARFLREARANRLLHSPYTVKINDLGLSDSGDLYLIMEKLDGESLGNRLMRMDHLNADEAVDISVQILFALSESHAKGILHRDLKPDNIFIEQSVREGKKEERVKILDFGMAKFFGSKQQDLNDFDTHHGVVFGTPKYMSPEQAQGKTLDARSDLYSVGVLLYHMLIGRPPFTDEDAMRVMLQHVKVPPPPPSEVYPELKIRPELQDILMWGLDKDPQKRPSSADEFITALERIKDLHSLKTRAIGSMVDRARSRRSLRTGLAIGFFGGLLLFGVIALYLQR